MRYILEISGGELKQYLRKAAMLNRVPEDLLDPLNKALCALKYPEAVVEEELDLVLHKFYSEYGEVNVENGNSHRHIDELCRSVESCVYEIARLCDTIKGLGPDVRHSVRIAEVGHGDNNDVIVVDIDERKKK